MRIPLVVIFSAALVAPALAQSRPANPDPPTPAVVTPNSPPTQGAPAAGANSFTEGQAQSRIEARGFTGVTGLSKDANGVWRGKASKGGRNVDVSVDYQGNVTPANDPTK